MLKIFNDLEPFFKDNYARIHVRKYAILKNISPPTASKELETLRKHGLLKKDISDKYFHYFANKDSLDFIDLQRMYYRLQLKDVIQHISEETINPTIYLFGSLAKAETTMQSDIDIAIITPTQKMLDVKKFEKKLGRTIQVFMFTDIEKIPSELRANILNGYRLRGNI
ncbi:MAG: nucleotidyltransferase domain-containing protein [Candidatus Woesearchaeota archaeon]